MKLKTIMTGFLLLTNTVYAKEVVIRLTQNYPSKQFQSSFIEKKEPLANLSLQQKNQIKKNILLYKTPEQDALPTHVDLGMNNVPVLDQGYHASCVSFSFIAALDALKGEGDYYSPLCFLNLGKHLEQYGYGASGWNYANNYLIFNRMRDFGLVPTTIQKTQGCGGLTEYPTYEVDNSYAMSPEEYHRYSESIEQSGFVDFKNLMKETDNPNRIIKLTRQAINAGNRVVILLAIPSDEYGGLHGSYKANQDSWVLSDLIVNKLNNQPSYMNGFYGHNVVITAYDDNAVIKDFNGKEHVGLFKVRNSWGDTVGDHGEFYVSYDFLASLGLQSFEIMK